MNQRSISSFDHCHPGLPHPNVSALLWTEVGCWLMRLRKNYTHIHDWSPQWEEGEGVDFFVATFLVYHLTVVIGWTHIIGLQCSGPKCYLNKWGRTVGVGCGRVAW